MLPSCPSCGARNARLSYHQTPWEYVKSWFGIYPLRCRHCRHRWEASVGPRWRYARCPRCYRQDLGSWSLRYYTPMGWTALAVRFGAHRYRCIGCRCNFASFLPCQERIGSKEAAEAQGARVSSS